MQPVIHRATPEDIASLSEMMRESYADANLPLDDGWARAAFSALLAEETHGAAWLAVEDAEVAGYVVLTTRFSMEYGGLDAFVDDFYVRPRFRRRGIGAALLASLFEECRRRGASAVHVETGRDNIAANAIYHRFGFRDTHHQLLTAVLGDPVTALAGDSDPP